MTNLYLQSLSLFYIIIISILFFHKKSVFSSETKLYTVIIIDVIFMLILDIIIVYLSYVNPDVAILYTMNKFYLISILLWSILLSSYIHVIINKKKKIIEIKQIILFVIGIIFIMILPIELYNTNNIMYTYGHSVTALFVCCLISYCYGTYLIFKGKKNIFTKKFIPLILLMILLLAAFFMRIFYPSVLLTSTIFTIVTIIMYHTIENPDAKLIAKLNQAVLNAEKANRAKSDFLSSMSHEIRTPLNAIVGLSDYIKDSDKLDNTLKEDVNDIMNASNTLLEIIGNIMDISKIENQKIEITYTTYNLKDMIDSVIKLNEFRLNEKNIKFNFSISEDVPLYLYGDRQHLKQIVNNLISNSCKYTDVGKIDIKVTCEIKKNICNLIILIADTGRGIKKENMSKLFTKFERLDTIKNSTIEGTGLGLAITKQLVSIMKGRINVQSSYGHGTTFTVYIPQKISSEKELLNKKTESTSFNLSNKKILLVDDNLLNIKVARRALESLNVIIEDVTSGDECIKKIKEGNKYDIILMDIMMPGMSGTDTLNKLKSIKDFNIPIIALTADATSSSLSNYRKQGFDDYVSKPFKSEVIRRVIYENIHK